MFNTYQELVDRIEELLKQREQLKQQMKKYEYLFSLIPRKVINTMYDNKLITTQERIFWEILQMRKEREKKNE